ncbi:hypothetical protein [Paenibacillus wynnii]|uniref:hypothetical protein n=1 Tax=Paenibacillus wynnii TaxID=268407 RepID=UPI00068D5644|nr:hypothetical protein [Paenibacillus wynnii]
MTIYSKTAWKDHIVDSEGAVVQQGTPLSAGNLLKIEEGLANATALTAGELGAVTAHSGVLEYVQNATGSVAAAVAGQVYVNYGIDWANAFGIKAFLSLIAGTAVNAPATSINKVTMPAPPTEGTRDDLVFLEAWRDQTTQEWKSRIRTVASVDFTVYTIDGFVSGAGAANLDFKGQGGLADITTDALAVFYGYGNRRATGSAGRKVSLDDVGLYVAGDGTVASKDALKTYDGYAYAIPLFKVNRRNSGAYSVNNPNGAREYFNITHDRSASVPGGTATLTNVTNYDKINVGDTLNSSANVAIYKVTAKNGDNTITTQNIYTSNLSSGTAITGYYVLSDRPDSLYANIIDDRDITDLRHKTYLVSPSYDQLLIDGTDQILRGASQVGRKKTMRKTYAGVRKTPLDANHIFYASLDSGSTAEIGGPITLGTGSFVPGPTGGAYRFNLGTMTPRTFGVAASTNEGTVEFFLTVQGAASGNSEGLINLDSAGGQRALGMYLNSVGVANVHIYGSDTVDTTLVYTTSGNPIPNGTNHIRITWKLGDSLKLYVNGKLAGTSLEYTTPGQAPVSVILGDLRTGAPSGGTGSFRATSRYSMSDVSISNIDRGATFATLPADFIAGYADIGPALNYQRRINSDAQTSQKSFASAKVQNQTQERGVTVTKGTGVNTAAWEAGDKIKVKGLAGEIIGGVIDTDTALAYIAEVNTASRTVVKVSDTSKLAVNDTIRLVASDGGVSGVFTVTAVDTTAGTIILNTATTWSYGSWLVETTASTSSPVVRAIIAGTSTTVPGTWANLGTNEAEVTLGTLPVGLDVEEIIIEYSLNMPAGQGSLYQVYTKALGGEANGKKLIPGTLAITDDFVGKVAGSTTINPNKAYSAVGSALATPTAPGTELAQADYDAIKTLDSSLKVVTTAVNGQQAQLVVMLDVITAVESVFGKIPGAYTIAEKITWIKANIGASAFNAWVYGSGPLGNKATTTDWTVSLSQWGSQILPQYGVSTTAAVPTKITKNMTNLTTSIDGNGFMSFIVFAEPSDGVTASTLYVDRVSIDMNIVTKAGYDTLVPESPRRDNGLSGVLYVRRSTREVESLFPGNDEDNGIIVIGEYVPTQDYASSLVGFKEILQGMRGLVTTAGTNRAYGSVNQYSNIITRILGPESDLNYKVDPQALVGTIPYEDSNNSVLRYWSIECPHSAGVSVGVYTDGIPAWAAKVAEFLCMVPRLIEYNGEIMLRVDIKKRSELTFVGLGGASTARYYRLPGRPLIRN